MRQFRIWKPCYHRRTSQTASLLLQKSPLPVYRSRTAKPRLDGIHAELIKLPDIAEELTPMLNAIYVSGNAPEASRRAAIVPSPKKGDLSQLGNWRGISLMSLLAKLYNHVPLSRLRPVLDPLLRKNENGFRPGRGCPEHILCLRHLIEGFKVKGGGGVIVFIDFRKALDSLRRECIPSLLAAMVYH